MTSTDHPLTVEGSERLRDELERLKSDERPAVIRAIAEARAHGDLSENAEYHAARERQGYIEARIRQLEGILSLSRVIDIKEIPFSGKVIFGTTVTVLESTTKSEMSYKIVGEAEADLDKGEISFTTPVAAALLGRQVGDLVEVETPAGVREFTINEIQHI